MRVSYLRVAPGIREAMRGLSAVAEPAGLEPLLVELVKLRASQLNRCAYCLDVHAARARELGEEPRRIDLLPTWRETPLYNERERAALAWCEALTLLPLGDASDADFQALARVFSQPEIVALTVEIVAINGWNRFEGAFRTPVRRNETKPQRPPTAG
jgi:AhpD family alkylhydroperoxidase